jgi:hypothetical protein
VTDYPSVSNGFEAFENYVSLKLHFSKWDYDFFHYCGRVKHLTPAAFKKRKDKYWFDKLSRLHSPFERILANCSANPQIWIKDIVAAPETYLDWQARQDTLTRTFTKEIERLKSIFAENFLYKPGMHPYLVREYMGGRISLETITIISDMTDCVSIWGSKIDDDPLFEAIIMRIVKYSPFLHYDHEVFEKILRTRLDR